MDHAVTHFWESHVIKVGSLIVFIAPKEWEDDSQTTRKLLCMFNDRLLRSWFNKGRNSLVLSRNSRASVAITSKLVSGDRIHLSLFFSVLLRKKNNNVTRTLHPKQLSLCTFSYLPIILWLSFFLLFFSKTKNSDSLNGRGNFWKASEGNLSRSRRVERETSKIDQWSLDQVTAGCDFRRESRWWRLKTNSVVEARSTVAATVSAATCPLEQSAVTIEVKPKTTSSKKKNKNEKSEQKKKKKNKEKQCGGYGSNWRKRERSQRSFGHDRSSQTPNGRHRRGGNVFRW